MITLGNVTIDTIMDGLLNGIGCDNCDGIMEKDEKTSSDDIIVVICPVCKKKVQFDLKEYPQSIMGVVLDEGTILDENDKDER